MLNVRLLRKLLARERKGEVKFELTFFCIVGDDGLPI